jgi:hypothetical protein
MLDELERLIEPLDQAVHQAAAVNADLRQLMTHPGAGPMVSLA